VILRSLRVAAWRCFIDSVEVGPFAEGLNVLHAPNATGKSTLFEALLRGLLAGHRGGGEEVRAIRPWGRALSPTVTVEFTHNGTDYRITKRFLDNASSKLEKKESARYVGLAEGDAADEKVREILAWNTTGRSLSKPINWGLAQVLWAPQGELRFGDLSGDVLADIRSSLGAQVSGPGASPLERRIEEAYSKVFTAGGKLKTGKDAPRIVMLKDRLNRAIERQSAAVQQHQAFTEASRRIEDLRASQAQARCHAETLRNALKEARSRAETYRALLSEREQKAERAKAAEAQHSQLKQRIDEIAAARKETKAKQELLHKLESEMPLHDREFRDRQKEATEAQAALENTRKQRQSVVDARELAEAARRFMENRRALTDADERIRKIRAAQEYLAGCKKERTDLVAPDAETLRSIRQAVKERDEAKLLIDSALITLEIVPQNDGSLEVVAGEELGTFPLHAGSPTEVKGSPEVVADLPGVARLRAWGPTGPIEEHRKKLAAAEYRLRDLTESFGTADVNTLEKLRGKAEELDKKVASAQAQVDTLLSGDTLDDIGTVRSRAAAVFESLLEGHPEWKESPPDTEFLKSSADEIEQSFIARVESAEKRWTAAEQAASAAAQQKAALDASLEKTRSDLASLENRLAALTADGKSDEDRQDALNKAALAWDAARAGLEETEKKLSGFVDDPVAAVDKLEKQLEAADEAATKALEEEKVEEGKLQTLAAQGLYSALAAAEEEVEALRTEIDREKLRVSAIRLMHDILAQCRAEALAAVAGPVEAAATRTLRRIAGERLGALKLGDSFEPAHVVPETAKSPVWLDSVSGGEGEQIYLATRLALAEVLAREERQLLVLDDVLAFTDAGRLARVMTVLEEAAQKLQVLILTCHPERYRGLGQASFADLQVILDRG